MHLPTHALIGWLLAESATLERRDRALVLVASVIPDLDALAVLGGVEAYQRWHHVILHNGAAALVCSLLALALAKRRLLTGALAFVGFHLHLLCDFLGSAGPDGSIWSIPYLAPLSLRGFTFPHQWGLASWQNVSITVLAFLITAHLGAKRGRTIVEVFSKRADGAVVEVLKRRWPL